MTPEGPSAQTPPAERTQLPVLKGRYEVGERLGEGVFFYSHRGRDLETGRTCAVKVLRPEYAGDEAFVQRLLADGEAVSRLQHQNLAQLSDLWKERGTVILITEWVRGISLADRIERVAPFPVQVVMDIALACAQALAAAHSKGQVHGDLRPENVIITPDGRVKVTDLGVGPAAAASSRIQLATLPRSAQHLSPEQIEGKPITPATDIYALGCLLFEMLTGRPPFQGDSPLAVAAGHLRDEPPQPRHLNSEVPNAVNGLVLKCLQKDPAARYASVQSLLEDIHTIRDALKEGGSLDWSPMKTTAVRGAPARTRPAPARQRPEREVPVEDGGPSWKLLLGVFLFFVLLVAGSVATVMVLTSAPDEVTVPTTLVGMREPDAATLIRKLGLVPQIQPGFSEKIPAGMVMSTDPKGGVEIRGGKPVVLVVSQGAEPAKVPELVGKTLPAAKKLLEESGLLLGEAREEFSEVIEKGQVLAQVPLAGETAKKKSAVTVVLSKGPEPIREPGDVDIQPGPADEPDTPPTEPATPPGELPSSRNEVAFDIPSRSRGPQQVRIVVRHEDGREETAYEAEHQPGDHVQQDVTTLGNPGKCQIRVYLNDRVIYRQSGPPFR